MLKEIRLFFTQGTLLARLIGLNILVFLVVSIFRVVFFLANEPTWSEAIGNFLGISSNVHVFLHRPWTLISYMFLHFDLLHILFNMVMLYVGGRLFSDFIGSDRLIPTYLLGGITGAIFYMTAFNVFPAFREIVNYSIAIGASASVLAIFIAVAVYMPNYRLPLILLGSIKLKYIAIFFIVLDVISIDKGNPGGHLAHLGGALWGYLYATVLRAGIDPARTLGRWADAVAGIFRKKSGFRVEYYRERPVTDEEYNDMRAAERKKMDQILDKISHSGYESLSKEEKKFLFKMGDN